MRQCCRQVVVVLLAVSAVTAAGPGLRTAEAAAEAGPRVLILGFDGMDPVLLRQYLDEGALPNFSRFLAQGAVVTPFGTAIPPQSPVAWSNFITGRDPGGHGIFDFIHRDPQTMLPRFSASEASAPDKFWKLGKWKIPRGSGKVKNLRQGTAFWELLPGADVDATIFKVPANFPPVDCEVRSLSGMGTPDITGSYGISTLITTDPPVERDLAGGRVESVYLQDGRFTATLAGPRNTWRQGDPEVLAAVEGVVDQEHEAVWLRAGTHEVVLKEGEWSDWVPVDFPMVPLLKSVHGICRYYLISTSPHLKLYATPVQLDPERPEMPISTPGGYSRELAEETGLFYTQGLPDDTSALENGFFADADFVRQSELVMAEHLAQLKSELDRFAGVERGLLYFYFNSPDQTCHMTWRNMDPGSPTHAHADPAHAGRIRDVYRDLDRALGLAIDRAGSDALIMVMSDHGFAPWNRAFHVNTWLMNHGYLVLDEGTMPTEVDMLRHVDWSRTRAYAIGLNGLYLNLAGREREGIVQPGAEAQGLLARLKAELEAVTDPLDGKPAIKYAYRADEVYHGAMRDTGPDIVVGYHRGWRGSNESALGRVTESEFSDNMLKWSGDHCMAADEVPGVLLVNRPIRRANPALVDMAPTILTLFGVPVPADMVGGDLFSE
ncbi:MAG: alkaline phosphatase family protein [bacterium]|nr:alkaline phosphatase family protein [bacterium]